ncbi:MAG TPA: hypothetical protein VGI19_04870 [Candidatus Cybelea sp.]|jgi:hypothetical protein
MKVSSLFAALVGVGAAIVVVSGCASVGPAPVSSRIAIPPTATPAAKWLYVDHLGTFYAYHLPLTSNAKPARTLPEWPGLAAPPAIAVGPYGDVALASTQAIRIFKPPIVSFDRSHAQLSLKLTPAITEVGPYGADLVDIEYDPNNNLWLLNNLGHEVSELRAPLSKKSVAGVRIAFGQPGTKTSGFSTLVQARFDVNAALYVYANAATISRLFKVSFPYAKQPSSIGINLAQADFVDSSQYLPTAGNPASVLLGQYIGALRSPKPGSPPSPPVDVMSQFSEPLQPTQGLFPNVHSDTVVSAVAADAPRLLFYTLALADGSLGAYQLPMQSNAKPKFSIRCLAGSSGCADGHDHLFLAP